MAAIKKQMWTTIVAAILSIIGFVMLFVFASAKNFNDWKWSIDPELADQFGSLSGGVIGILFSLAGIFLLYETIIRQQRLFNVQQFESKYFELIRYHRENVQEITYKVPDSKEEIVAGRSFFVQLNDEFIQLFRSISDHTRDGFTEEERIELTAIILYYGVAKKTLHTLKYNLSRYDAGIIDDLIEHLRKEKTKYDRNIVFYGGHQHRLDHYLRHQSQAIKFIDRANFLTKDQKYSYAKLVRAQLTQYELIYLFYNTLTIYGQSWRNYKLITKYQLIKNLPKELETKVQPKKYYPKVKFDWERV